VIGGGRGGTEAKIKNEQGKQKKNSSTKKVLKKNCVRVAPKFGK
jgi:hypothetical protein